VVVKGFFSSSVQTPGLTTAALSDCHICSGTHTALTAFPFTSSCHSSTPHLPSPPNLPQHLSCTNPASPPSSPQLYHPPEVMLSFYTLVVLGDLKLPNAPSFGLLPETFPGWTMALSFFDPDTPP